MFISLVYTHTHTQFTTVRHALESSSRGRFPSEAHLFKKLSDNSWTQNFIFLSTREQTSLHPILKLSLYFRLKLCMSKSFGFTVNYSGFARISPVRIPWPANSIFHELIQCNNFHSVQRIILVLGAAAWLWGPVLKGTHAVLSMSETQIEITGNFINFNV